MRSYTPPAPRPEDVARMLFLTASTIHVRHFFPPHHKADNDN